jgi:energy-coupling factor transporter ATP-binding protein EcfA2
MNENAEGKGIAAPGLASTQQEEVSNEMNEEALNDIPSSEEAYLAHLEQEAEDYAAEVEQSKQLAEARATKVRSVERLVKMPVVERRFLIGPDLLPKQGRMLITGKSGTGKSTLTLILAACLASKIPLFGIFNRHKDEDYGKPIFPIADASSILYVDYELPEGIRTDKRLRPLLEQFPEAFQRNLFFPPHASLYRLHNQAGEAPDKGSYDALSNLLRSVRPDVLIVDPLSSTHSLDENSIAIKQALNNVDRLIDLYGCAAIVVHHSSTKAPIGKDGKQVKKDTIAEPRGHSSLVDWCDVHMHFEAEKADPDSDSEENEEPSQAKIITMRFGKARYCRKPDKRRLLVDFDAMRVSPVRKHQRPEKSWGEPLIAASSAG